MDLGLKGRRAVVTGGTKGIGRAILAELAAEGAVVAFCARDEAAVRETEQSLRDEGATAHGFRADVRKVDDVESFISSSAEVLGGIDILVNNAGGAHPGNFESLTDEDWHDDLDVKLFSQIRCSRAALPHLRRSEAPRIVNINAVYGKHPDPAFFATTVIRAACLNLTKVMAQELGPEGILVNSVNIGFVATPQWENIRRRRAPELTEEQFFARLAEAEVPLGRFGTVDEVSGVVAFLASDRASYLTGSMIDVAGGMGKYV
jgi:3-oxoacyl-[acyl-carrier protein] reductase